MSRTQFTKQVVDNHVSNILKQQKDEKQRRLRGFQFARMYFDVGEYDTAKRYLTAFIAEKGNLAAAHRLLGQIQEMQQQPALAAYKRSLELDSSQNDVLLKVCELYYQSPNLSPDIAKFWAEKAEKVFPGHDVVFHLKLRAREADNSANTQQELVDLLLAETEKHQWDVIRHIRLLRQYMSMDAINEAYTRITTLSPRVQCSFATSLDWNRCICDVFKMYKDQTGADINGTFYQQYLTALNNLTTLCLEKASVQDAVGALWNFDQVMMLASEDICDRDDWKIFRREMEAQFYFHCGTVILDKALKEHLNWTDAETLCTACYLVSYSVLPPHNRSACFACGTEDDRKVYMEWIKSANFRVSQIGHMFNIFRPKSLGQNWFRKIHMGFCGVQGRDRLFELLFTQPHQKDQFAHSFLTTNSLFTTFSPRFPDDGDELQLKDYDQRALEHRPASLHHTAWLCLQYYSMKFDSQPDYGLIFFENLPYEAQNLDSAGPESLRQLDVEAFLNAVVRKAALKLASRQTIQNSDQPFMLPAAISESLCTPEQQEWWNSVYQVSTNTARESLGQVRAVLQRGLETIRLVGHGGLDVDLVVHLARTFAFRAEEMQTRALTADDFITEIQFLQSRATHYWRKAVEKLEKLERNRMTHTPKYSLFENHDEQLSESDICSYLDEGRLFLAKHAGEKGLYTEALKMLNRVHTAEASFQTALVYKLCAEREALPQVRKDGSEETIRERRIVLLTKSKDALYLTLDRIRGDRFHVLNNKVAEEMDIVENHLTALTNTDAVDEEDYYAGDVHATPSRKSLPHGFSGASSSAFDSYVVQSTPRFGQATANSPLVSGRRLPASPDRLDAEMRSLRFMHENLVKTVTDELRAVRSILMDRLSGIESKLAVVMEFQRNQAWLSPALTRHVIQAAQMPNQASAMPAAAAVEQSAYSAASTYDALMYKQQFGQAAAVSLPAQSSCFAAYPNCGINANYLLPSGNVEQHLAQESDSYAGEQCFYNDDDYQDNGLGYEIPPNYLPLTSQELFLSGGDAARSASTAQILPGFFSSSVKQCLSDKTAGGTVEAVTVTQSAGLNPVMAISAVKSDASAAESVTAAPKSVSAGLSSLPLSTEALNKTSPLAAPKFFPSPSTMAVTTTVSAASDSETKPDDGNKSLFGGFSFTTAPPVVPVDKSNDEKKAADKPVSKLGNPFASFSFSSPAASKAGDKAGTESVISKPTFGGFSGFSTTVPASVGDQLTGSELPVFGSGVKAAPSTFADLANQEVKGFSTKVNNSNLFKTASEELFQHSSGKSPGSAGKANVSAGHEDDEEYVPDQEFQPLVSLPEVDVKTGEEDEEKLFGERAKLFRMDDESKQWKERGIGEIKILRNRVSGRFRIVMRREQVLKLCANHYVTAAMKLMPMKTSETSLCWVASDYSEGEVRKEQLCVKFKTVDITQKFRSCFEDCQLKCGQGRTGQTQLSADSQPAESTDVNTPLSALFKPKSGQWVCSGCYITNESDDVTCIACMTPKPGVAPVTVEQPTVSCSTTAPPLSSLFQAKAGEWDCASCYVQNGADKMVCVACATPKPGGTVTADSLLLPKSDSAFKIAPTGGFTFSAISGKPFTFGGTAASATSGTTGSSGSSNQLTSVTTPVTCSASGFVMPFGFKPVSTTGSSSSTTPVFTFGTPQPGKNGASVKPGANVFQSLSKPPAPSNVTSGAPGIFQSSSSTPSFALLSSTPATGSKTNENKALFGTPSFVFEGVKPVSSLNSLTKAGTGSSFNFSTLSLASPAQHPALSSPCSPTSPDNELYETGADDEPDVSFEPVVRLPDDVEVKTGEEEEDVLYSQRAKLYRFVDNEWKERGIGDVKLLRHRSTGIVRIIMRRERVLKLCLNHRINAALMLQPMLNAQGKAWTWHADDFSDSSEPTHEKFSIRFKTEDIAAEFKQTFDRVKHGKILPVVDSSRSDNAGAPQCPGPSVLEELLADGSTEDHDATDSAASDDCVVVHVKMPPEELVKKAVSLQLPPTFYNYLALPECPGCIGCRSSSESSNVEVPSTDAVDVADGESQKVFGGSAASVGFGQLASKTFGRSPAVFGSISTMSDQKPSSSAAAERAANSSVFGSSTKVVGFADLLASGSGAGDFNKKSGDVSFTWAGSGTQLFSPQTAKSDDVEHGANDSHDEGQDDDGYSADNIHFEPIVQLPEAVDLKTGEEDEEEIYRQRAKLYRYDDNAWKERGTGEMKILKNTSTGNYRLLMRREQVHKVACNHLLSAEIRLQPLQTSETTWCWFAMDYTEDEPAMQNFACRFKNAEVAKEFHDAVTKCQSELSTGTSGEVDKPEASSKEAETTS